MPSTLRTAFLAACGVFASLMFATGQSPAQAPPEPAPPAESPATPPEPAATEAIGGQAEAPAVEAKKEADSPAAEVKSEAEAKPEEAKAEKPEPPVPSDLSGVVKKIDVDARKLWIVEDGTGRERVVVLADPSKLSLTNQVNSTLGGGKKLNFARLKPGFHVVIRDTTDAAEIQVKGASMGSLAAYDAASHKLSLVDDSSNKKVDLIVAPEVHVVGPDGKVKMDLANLPVGTRLSAIHGASDTPIDTVIVEAIPRSIAEDFFDNFRHNLFKPLLLFFYMGFLVPILKVKFEFPYVIYQGLTIFLLIAIGWKGGEELSLLTVEELPPALGFMATGFMLNFLIGLIAYLGLSALAPKMRRIDKATVSGYYGSDSAGTFVTCLGVLATAGIAYEAYMPVMLAVMEIPGCLVALYLVSRLRASGMDPAGTMPDEVGYDPHAPAPLAVSEGHGGGGGHTQKEIALEKMEHSLGGNGARPKGFLTPQLLHEVFLNPGLYLLFGGILIGFFSGLQGPKVTRDDDNFFIVLFQGILCLFLLEMGMTASRKLKDLAAAGPGYVAFALLFPNIFATLGIMVAHLYSHFTHTPFQLGTYVLFSVLCGAASYIAVPAVQRLAIPEASPTLPLAASLGITFSYNVTIGIPIYIEIAKYAMRTFPV